MRCPGLLVEAKSHNYRANNTERTRASCKAPQLGRPAHVILRFFRALLLHLLLYEYHDRTPSSRVRYLSEMLWSSGASVDLRRCLTLKASIHNWESSVLGSPARPASRRRVSARGLLLEVHLPASNTLALHAIALHSAPRYREPQYPVARTCKPLVSLSAPSAQPSCARTSSPEGSKWGRR